MSEAYGSQIVICGNTYLEVETFSGMVIEIWGTGLMLSDYNTEGIAVRGHISSVELHGSE